MLASLCTVEGVFRIQGSEPLPARVLKASTHETSSSPGLAKLVDTSEGVFFCVDALSPTPKP